jgi:hypothetical protein
MESTTDNDNDKNFVSDETAPQKGSVGDKIDFAELETTIDQLEADANEISDYFRS